MNALTTLFKTPLAKGLQPIWPHLKELRVLLIEDNRPVRDACAAVSTSFGFSTEVAGSIAEARAALHRGPVDIVLLDLNLGDQSGLSLVDEIKCFHPRATIVVMTAYATVRSAIVGLRNGVSDYLEKPFTVDELKTALGRAACRPIFDAEARRLNEEFRKSRTREKVLITRSPAMSKIYRTITRVAFTANPVLILGDRGTGKEYVARAIHQNGPKGAEPFRVVDCGTSDAATLEHELFGDIADPLASDKRVDLRRLRSAPGTLFLKGVGALPLYLQDRLLDVLRGCTNGSPNLATPTSFRARLLAGSSRELSAMVEAGEFRKDLFNRLNITNIRIPPLRERREDIPLIILSVLDATSREDGQKYQFADDAIILLMSYDWPGDVRELEQALRYACALSSGLLLHACDFPMAVLPTKSEDDYDHMSHLTEYDSDLQGVGASPLRILPIVEMEKSAIIATLRQLKGDKLSAAKLLGIGKTTLYRKLKEHGISNDIG